MLAGSTTAPSTISTDTSPVISPPAARPARRRGLSYLRSYTFGIDASRHITPTEIEGRFRNRSSTNAADLAPDPARQHILEPFHEPSRPNNAPNSQRRATQTDDTMTRARNNAGLDGAGVSTANEYTSRPLPLPVMPHTRALVDAHQSLLARTDGTSSTPAPCIQFIPATDPIRSQRPSLDFKRITRILPNPNSIIKVGRYSERDVTQEAAFSEPSDAPIGFKSKVVSRKHCEFSFSDGQWYVKDVKSSSGTFLNHIRLSQPGVESKPFPVNDGDVIQLGIDFKGGEEMIFRCVKIRIETNRGWQRGLNKFNKSTHKQLQRLAKGKKEVDSDAASKHSSECTICLNSIAPCQALFVAPCSHTWHYKCIRTILESSKYPSFLCPNCRAQADLDAEVEEEDLEDFDDFDEAELDGPARVLLGLDSEHTSSRHANGAIEMPSAGARSGNILEERGSPRVVSPSTDGEPDTPSLFNSDDLAWTLNSMSLRQNSAQLPSLDDTISGFPTSSSRPSSNARRSSAEPRNGSALNPSASTFIPSPPSSEPMAIPTPPSNGLGAGLADIKTHRSSRTRSSTFDGNETLIQGEAHADGARVTSADALQREGPMTPRNAAGPFVFDGAGRTGSSTRGSVDTPRERDRRGTLRESTMVGTDTEMS